jgi:hypothetical protein
MKIAFIGYGQVGAPLADHLQRIGHQVTLAATDPNSESVKKALIRNASLKVAPPRNAVRDAEVIFLATPFQANEAALEAVADEIQGKILIDCTNPVGPNLSHGLNSVQSGSEMVQKLIPNTGSQGFHDLMFRELRGFVLPRLQRETGNDVLWPGFRGQGDRGQTDFAARLGSARRWRSRTGAPFGTHDASMGAHGSRQWPLPQHGMGHADSVTKRLPPNKALHRKAPQRSIAAGEFGRQAPPGTHRHDVETHIP